MKQSPPLPYSGGGQGSQNVVGLVPVLFHDGASHQTEQFLDDRELFREFIRHSLSSRLICRVSLMTESRRLTIEGNRYTVRRGLIPQFKKYIKKSYQCVGIVSILGCKQFDAVKRPVEDAVSIENQ